MLVRGNFLKISIYLHQVWSPPPKWVPFNDPCQNRPLPRNPENRPLQKETKQLSSDSIHFQVLLLLVSGMVKLDIKVRFCTSIFVKSWFHHSCFYKKKHMLHIWNHKDQRWWRIKAQNKSNGEIQWLFLVPLKGGRWHIIPQLAVYTTYIITTSILPSGGLFATYHLLREPETTIEEKWESTYI